jgi:hypothetical protein
MKKAGCFGLCVLSVLFVCSGETEKKSDVPILCMAVSQEVPETERAGHTPYSYSGSLKVRNDLSPEIRSREFHYAWFWLVSPLATGYSSSVKEDDVLFLSEIGPRGDEGLLFKWKAKGCTFEAVDSRVLTLVIQKKGLGQMDVMNVFTTLVNYAGSAHKGDTPVVLEERGCTKEGASYGQIRVDQWWGYGRLFTEPVGWYKDGDFLLLVFEKTINKLPSLKGGGYTSEGAARLVDGARWDDERSYLRFEKSNRVQLAGEYLTNVLLPNQPKPVIDYSKTHGRPVNMGDGIGK